MKESVALERSLATRIRPRGRGLLVGHDIVYIITAGSGTLWCTHIYIYMHMHTRTYSWERDRESLLYTIL